MHSLTVLSPAARRVAPLLGICLVTGMAEAGWDNRYAKVEDFNHHVYLEQHEMPFLSAGPVDPAAAPDGRHLAFAAQGWLWRLDLESGVAERLTRGPAVDGRPRWSADGGRVAFVRDDGSDTSIVVLDLATGRETLIDSPTLELDPEFSADGSFLFYTSGRSGVLELWRRHLAAGTDEQLTSLYQVERSARRLAGGDAIAYLHGSYPQRNIRLRDFVAGTDVIVRPGNLALTMGFDAHPVERSLVVTEPRDDDYHIVIADIDDPVSRRQLTPPGSYALMPAFSANGETVYFVTPDATQQFRLMQLPTAGGTASEVAIREWRYGERTGRLVVRTRDAQGNPSPARVAVRRSDGHPLASTTGPTYFDPAHGHHYFYSDGEIAFDVPAGRYELRAVRGPMTPVTTATVTVRGGSDAGTELVIDSLWDARAAGYASADLHVHLNADGNTRMTLADALPLMRGEALDHLVPMAWNRFDRLIDAPLVGREARDGEGYTARMAQEVRSHFHGHVGMIDARRAHYPWFFGPNMPRFGSPDRSNAEAMAFAQANDILPTYVHPIGMPQDPFDDLAANPIPLEFVSDALLSDGVGLELVCMWTNPLGTAEVWYRLLNLGRPVVATSGTDMMSDFQRAPALGTARLYAEVGDGPRDFDRVLEQVRAGRTFVTMGPALLFAVGDGARPGDTVAAGTRSWRVDLHSTEPVDVVEIIVNGEVVQSYDGIAAGESRRYEGTVDLPDGGWIAARAHGGGGEWPGMAVDQFAHASPVWIGEVGSIDDDAAARAARELLAAIDFAETTARDAYGDTPVPRLLARFAAAREVLRQYLRDDESQAVD